MISAIEGKNIGPRLTMTLVAALIKLILIQYGLPFQTHVDEMTILKDPFKLALDYMQGDFSSPTNLYNWLLTGWFSLFFLGGQITGRWHNLTEFKTFLISDSYEILLFGRLLSALLSLAAIWILLKLISEITSKKTWWWAFALLVVFNPIDINSTSWVKFDAPVFLAYALILFFAHQYFWLGDTSKRAWLYLAMILGLSVRIETISYFIGFGIYDLFLFRREKGETWLQRVRPLIKPFAIGVPAYLLLTLHPLSLVYRLLSKSKAESLTTSPTFEKAILSKIPLSDGLFESIIHSEFYIYCFVSLLGPFIFYALAFGWRHKTIRFLYPPIFIMIFFITVFPSKGTHYLLNISIISIFLFILFVMQLKSAPWRNILVAGSLLWVCSFSIIQLSILVKIGDVRKLAATYLLNNTSSSDCIYYEGIFSQIPDKPERYAIKAEAARASGSTGLSNDYFAKHLTDRSTRLMKEVTAYDPFEGTKYQGFFINNFNFDSLLTDSPKYYVSVGQYFGQTKLNQTDYFPKHVQFYDSLQKHSKIETMFDYPHIDPRLRFATSYYFRPVVVYKLF